MSAKTLYTVASLANIIGVGVGGFLILQGSLSAAMMLAATGYFSEISNSLSNLIEEAVTFRSTKELAKKLEEERNFPCPAERGLACEEKPAITYQKVSFSFDQRQLYQNFCHVFRPGGCYAIVGERQRKDDLGQAAAQVLRPLHRENLLRKSGHSGYGGKRDFSPGFRSQPIRLFV